MKFRLTTNSEPKPKSDSFETFTFNQTALARNGEMEGEQYLIIPMVMMVEGVHNGSNGPLMYPKEELSKIPESWNHKPVVVYHPTVNGKGVSACSPEILTKYKIGMIMNAKIEGDKLKAEAWLKPTRIAKVDNRVQEAIDNNSMMEVSTGVFTENEEVAGEWNGEKYVAIARNYRPDHLAILPDQIGACSIKDGAGLMRNAEGRKPSPGRIQSVINRLLEAAGLQDNQLSHSDIHKRLRELIREKVNGANADAIGKSEDERKYVWIEDVFTNFFVYEYDNKLWRINFQNVDDELSLSGEPVEVRRVTRYETVNDPAPTQNQTKIQQHPKKEKTMDKKTIVDGLIGNSGWSEEDREFLMGLEDSKLTKIQHNAEAKEQEANKTADKKPEVPANNTKTEEPAKPQTVEEFISNAPAGVAEVLRSGLNTLQEEKSKLIKQITDNEANSFTEDQLKGKDISELKAIAGFCKPVANYEGMAQTATHNASSDVPILAVPTVNKAKTEDK